MLLPKESGLQSALNTDQYPSQFGSYYFALNPCLFENYNLCATVFMNDNEEIKMISIDSALYEQLKAYCDGEDIRFKDFIEDSLETAMERHEHYKVLGELKELQTEIVQVKDRSYQRGFQKGCFVSFLLKTGNIRAASGDSALKENKKVYLEKPVEGPQLLLF